MSGLRGHRYRLYNCITVCVCVCVCVWCVVCGVWWCVCVCGVCACTRVCVCVCVCVWCVVQLLSIHAQPLPPPHVSTTPW